MDLLIKIFKNYIFFKKRVSEILVKEKGNGRIIFESFDFCNDF